MVEAAITVFYQLRDLGLQRKPSTSEIIDWLTYLKRNGQISPEDLKRLEGYQTLVKHKDDLPVLESIREKGVDQVITEIQTATRGFRKRY